MALARIPLKSKNTKNRRNFSHKPSSVYGSRMSTNRSLETDETEASKDVNKGFKLASKQVRCKSKEINRNHPNFSSGNLPTPQNLKKKEEEMMYNFKSMSPLDDNDYDLKKIKDNIISFPSKKEKVTSLDLQGQRSYTPYKHKIKLNTPQTGDKNTESKTNMKFTNKILEFKKSGNISYLFPESTKTKGETKPSYQFPKNLQMIGKQNLQKLKHKSIKKKFKLDLDQEIDTVKNMETIPKHNGIIHDYGTCSKMGKSLRDPLKPNQDSYIQKPNLYAKEFNSPSQSTVEQVHLFGVLDGHGSEGHVISGAIKSKLPTMIKINLNPIPDSLNDVLIDTVMKVDKDMDQECKYGNNL